MSEGTLRLALACALLAFLLGPATVAAAEPVPETLAAERGSDDEETLAARSLADLEEAVRDGRDTDARLVARSRLVLLGTVGLRHVAERLATADVPNSLLPHLLHVVAACAHPAADVLLAREAASPRSEVRMRVADGLGRGRTEAAVDVLEALARDPVPGVRVAALRSLFALEFPAARDARTSLSVDARPDLHARRLRWHRVRGDASPELRDMAVDAWEGGRTADERLEAAQLLVRPSMQTPLATLADIVTETGTDALGARLARLTRGVPRQGYDSHAMRTVAILAAWGIYAHGEASEAQRDRMVDRLVEWLARPVPRDPLSERPVPGNVLRMALPDLGAPVVEPTLRRLREGRFRDPQDGTNLIVEALPAAEAVTVLSTLLHPEADPPVPAAVRMAAAGGLRDVGAVGDESLARLLLRPEEALGIRREVLHAVAEEDAPWVVPLLWDVVLARDPALWTTAVSALERRRDEPAARARLVEHLFHPAPRPIVRMEAVVEPADDTAYAVLERALKDPRGALRRAALHQLHQVASLDTEKARALLRAYEVRAEGKNERTHEIQQVLYAYFRLLPDESVPWMRAHWPDFERLDWAPIALRSLQNLRGEQAAKAVVDLVLEQVAKTEDPVRLTEAATALAGREGHRDDEVDAFWRRQLESADPSLQTSALLSLDHPTRSDLTDVLLPRLAALNLRDEEHVDEALRIFDVLEHQPAEKVTPVALSYVFDSDVHPTLRRRAAEVLPEEPPADVRGKLLDWLTSDAAAEGARSLDAEDETPALLREVAIRAATPGDAEAAGRCLEVLRRRLDAVFAEERSLDPREERNVEPADDLTALARAVARSGHVPAITGVVDLVLDPRFALYARRAVAERAGRLEPTGVTAAAHVTGDRPFDVWHWQGMDIHPLPYEVSLLVDALKPLDDGRLAGAFGASLGARRADGQLAEFPDVYVDRLAVQLRARLTGVHAGAALLLDTSVLSLEATDGIADFFAAQNMVESAVRRRDFDAAATAQAHVVRIMARRSYDDAAGRDWKRERAYLDALRGAARAVADGGAVEAEALFDRAAARHPYDATTLVRTARLRALTRTKLDVALALAARARHLERRVWGRPAPETGNTLALVLLLLDRRNAAVRAIAEVMPGVGSRPEIGGRHHVRLAQTLAEVGAVGEAERALRQALDREPTLVEGLRVDPHLAPLRKTGRLEALVEDVEAERWRR